MKIGIISDTHDDIACTKVAIEIFKKQKVNFVIHLGDYVSPPIVRLFKGVKLIGIFGNNDGYKFVLAKAFNEIGGEMKGDFGIIELDNLKIALYHGEFSEISEALAKSGDYDAVFTGHWHKSSIKKIGKTLWISMGSAKKEFAENNKPAVGIFETKTREAELIFIR
ncbi:MAG: metallophosphoesterase [Minisyncoccia bacterium]